MRIVGYIRDSLDCAVDEILDPEEQRRAITRWATANQYELVGVYADQGFNASSELETRLGLADAMAAVRDGRASAIIVARLDRIAPSLILQEYLQAELEHIQGRLLSASPADSDELDDPSAERLLVRDVLREIPKHKRAMRDLWVRQRSRRFPRSDDAEEASLARIEHLAERGLSVRAIAQTLSAEGFRPRLSHVFDTSGLARIVRRIRPS